jgi:hypothetical protein
MSCLWPTLSSAMVARSGEWVGLQESRRMRLIERLLRTKFSIEDEDIRLRILRRSTEGYIEENSKRTVFNQSDEAGELLLNFTMMR